MEHKRIPWYEPHIGQKEIEHVKAVLESNFPNQGAYASTFEEKMRDMLQMKHAILTTSGTAAIFLALKALGIGHGDEVIVPDITFIATANAVVLAGATPVLVDVEPERLTLDPALLETALTPRTRAIVPVHVTGRAADMGRILAFAKAHDLLVVEDAAEALLSKHEGSYLGTFGDAGCFSFSAMKLITSGQGGMIITNSDELAEKMKGLKNHGIIGRGTGGDDVHPSVGFNFKFTDIQAAVLLGQSEYLQERVEQSRARHRTYMRELAEIGEISFYPFDLGAGELPLWTDIRTENRDALEAALLEKNMSGRRYWHPVHRQEPYRQPDGAFPVSSRLSPVSFWLPSAFTSSEEDVLAVCREIRQFFGR